MNSLVTLAVSTKASALAGLRAALQGAVDHVTWRIAGGTLAIAIVPAAWSVFGDSRREPNLPAVDAYLSATIINVLVAFSIMFSSLTSGSPGARNGCLPIRGPW
jgi:hypothetical protein